MKESRDSFLGHGEGGRRGRTVTARGHPRHKAFVGRDYRVERVTRFAASGHCFVAREISFDRASALFQATDLRGNRTNTQNAGDDREGLLLPPFPPLPTPPRTHLTLCTRFLLTHSTYATP